MPWSPCLLTRRHGSMAAWRHPRARSHPSYGSTAARRHRRYQEARTMPVQRECAWGVPPCCEVESAQCRLHLAAWPHAPCAALGHPRDEALDALDGGGGAGEALDAPREAHRTAALFCGVLDRTRPCFAAPRCASRFTPASLRAGHKLPSDRGQAVEGPEPQRGMGPEPQRGLSDSVSARHGARRPCVLSGGGGQSPVGFEGLHGRPRAGTGADGGVRRQPAAQRGPAAGRDDAARVRDDAGGE